MSTTRSAPVGVLTVAFAATLGVTVGVAFLLTGPEQRGDKFVLALATLGVAELLLFLGSPLLGRRFAGMGLFATGYAMGVAVLVCVGLTAISFKVLLVLHLVLSLVLFLGICGSYVQGSHFAATASDDAAARAPMLELRDQLDTIMDRLELSQAEGAAAVLGAVRELSTAVAAAAPRSCPACADQDRELNTAAGKLAAAVRSLGSGTSSHGQTETEDLLVRITQLLRARAKAIGDAQRAVD